MVLPTFSPGHDLAGRYRIIELLGVGNTAEVYSAEDLSLSRTVIVKVLLPTLAQHEEVRRAFRDHIVRAATLSHPHLARVFDGGQESGAIFMITEYLSGGSLEDVLASGRTLEIDDVARLGRDVAGALAYVHMNGFVHGELSPSKLLFDDEGRVRVSDIALAGLGLNFREHLTLDDVRYMSPEQAVGERAGAESDVYALALILFEAATGVAAFDGMTPESMLRSRINAPLPVRVELGTLDMLLAQAAVSDPRLRLNAEQFASRLSAVVSDSAPLVVRSRQGDVPLLAQFTPSEPRTSIGFRPPSPEQVVGSRAVQSGPDAQYSSAETPGGTARDRPRGFEAARRSSPRGFDALPPSRPTRGRRLAFSLAAVLIVLAAVGAGAAWKLGYLSTKHTVPQLVDLTYKQASEQLAGDGFTVTIGKQVSSATVPAHKIVAQTPAPGTVSKSGLVIVVTVSSGPVLVTLPTNLIGATCATATAKLQALKIGAQCPSTSAIRSTRTATGLVAEVLYRNTRNPLAVPAHSTVILALSSGPGPVSSTTTTTTAPVTSSTATTTTTVAGEGLRAMPNVAGMTRAEVNTALHNAGLYYSTRGPGADSPTWTTVVSSVPAAGTMVKWHSNVILNVR
jgi:serine/threonine-protein kinase